MNQPARRNVDTCLTNQFPFLEKKKEGFLRGQAAQLPEAKQGSRGPVESRGDHLQVFAWGLTGTTRQVENHCREKPLKFWTIFPPQMVRPLPTPLPSFFQLQSHLSTKGMESSAQQAKCYEAFRILNNFHQVGSVNSPQSALGSSPPVPSMWATTSLLCRTVK